MKDCKYTKINNCVSMREYSNGDYGITFSGGGSHGWYFEFSKENKLKFKQQRSAYGVGKVSKNELKNWHGFKGILEEIWNFKIGGYHVCEKWLKDRQDKTKGKNIKNLSTQDIEHYKKIIATISETIQIMHEIDRVIEGRGGWPEAFKKQDI